MLGWPQQQCLVLLSPVDLQNLYECILYLGISYLLLFQSVLLFRTQDSIIIQFHFPLSLHQIIVKEFLIITTELWLPVLTECLRLYAKISKLSKCITSRTLSPMGNITKSPSRLCLSYCTLSQCIRVKPFCLRYPKKGITKRT